MANDRVYKDLIWQNPDRVSGAVCFYGHRIPVRHLFDHLEEGLGAEEFASRFDLPIEQARGVLELAIGSLDRALDEAA